MMVSQGCGEGDKDSYCLMGTVGEDEKVLKMDGGDGSTAI